MEPSPHHIMKLTLMLSALLLSPVSATPQLRPTTITTQAPASLDGKQILINLEGSQEANTEMGEKPTNWKDTKSTPLVLTFPTNAHNSFSYQLNETSPDTPWPPLQVTYTPNQSTISITGNDLAVDISLSFTAPTEGTVNFTWHEDGGSWYVRNASFLITEQASQQGSIIMPHPEEEDGALQTVDDGLRQLVLDLEKRQYKTAVERLYQKRLLTLLPQIMEGGDVNNVLSNANGTTALHNACGLSCVEIVQWLIDHGADLNAKTAKGASVDACVGGPNAKAIRDILRKARQ